MPFDGDTYVRERDGERLSLQLEHVQWVYCDEEWHTLYEAQAAIKKEFGIEWPLQAISARVRDFRKDKFGGFIVEREYVEKGVHKYRVLWS